MTEDILNVPEVTLEEMIQDKEYLESLHYHVAIVTKEGYLMARTMSIILEKCRIDSYKTAYLVGRDNY